MHESEFALGRQSCFGKKLLGGGKLKLLGGQNYSGEAKLLGGGNLARGKYSGQESCSGEVLGGGKIARGRQSCSGEVLWAGGCSEEVNENENA